MKLPTLCCILLLAGTLNGPVAQASDDADPRSAVAIHDCNLPFPWRDGPPDHHICGTFDGTCTSWITEGPPTERAGTPVFRLEVDTQWSPGTTVVVCEGTLELQIMHWGGKGFNRWGNTWVGAPESLRDGPLPASEDGCTYMAGISSCVTTHRVDYHFTEHLPYQKIIGDDGAILVDLEIRNTRTVPAPSHTDPLMIGSQVHTVDLVTLVMIGEATPWCPDPQGPDACEVQ